MQLFLLLFSLFPSFVFMFPLILCFASTLCSSRSIFPVKPSVMWLFLFNNLIWNRLWHCQRFLVWCAIEIYLCTHIDEIVEVFVREWQLPGWHRKHSTCFRNTLKQHFELWSQWIHRGGRMGEELVQFVGVFFFFLVCFPFCSGWEHIMLALGRMGGHLLGISWKRSTEGPQWSHLPVVALPQCVPCVSEAGQMGCPLAPSDIIGQIQSLWFPHLLSGVSGDVKGCRARQQLQGHCSPMVPEKGKWICPGLPPKASSAHLCSAFSPLHCIGFLCHTETIQESFLCSSTSLKNVPLVLINMGLGICCCSSVCSRSQAHTADFGVYSPSIWRTFF